MNPKQFFFLLLLIALFDWTAYSAHLPLYFEKSPGAEAKFISRGRGYEMSLARKQIRVKLSNSHAIELDPAYGSELPEPEGIDATGGHSNYLIGNNPDAWRTLVPHFRRVRYNRIYRGIDLVFYGNQNQLEYDFIVRAGADPSKIAMQFKGASSYELNSQGDLILNAGNVRISQRKPNAYQIAGGKRSPIAITYLLSNTPGLIRFKLGKYDPHRPLIIDPILSYGTFVGGSGTDFASAVAADSAGSAYIGGSTSSLSIPGRPPQQFLRGPSDCYITKIHPDGTSILYTTYIGGGGSETCSSLTVDNQGNVYAAGTTTSNDFPVTAGAVQTKYAGGDFDGFVLKLNNAGTGFMYSTFIGGSGPDVLNAIAIDGSGNAYVAGTTNSTNVIEIGSDAAIQFRNAGGSDAFLVKLNTTGTGVVYGTYLGGSGDDAARGLAVNFRDEAYVTGDTASPTFPGTAKSVIQPFRKGAKRDAFLTKIAANGFSIVYSTFIGGSADQSAAAVALDSAGTAFITGFTNSVDFPIKGTPVQARNQGGADAFVAGIADDGSRLLFSTYLGGKDSDFGQSILVNRRGSVYVGGFTNSANFLQSYRALPLPGVNSLFVTKISPSLGKVLFSTYFSPGDEQAPIALGLGAGNSFDQIFIAGTAVSGFRFPASKSPPLLPYAGGLSDAFVSRLSNANVSIVSGTSNSFGSPGQRSAVSVPRSANAIPGSSVDLPFTVTNQGPDDADDVVATVTIPTSLTPIRCVAPGGTCTIAGALVTVRYAGLRANIDIRMFTVTARAITTGNYSAEVEVNSATDDGNTINNTATVAINIIGQVPFVTNPVVAVDFGSVNVSQSRVSTIRVTPTVPVDLQLVLTDAQGGQPTAFTLQSGTNPTMRIAVPTDIPIVFAPTGQGAVNAQLDIRSSNPAFTATLDLNGTGVAAPPPTISAVRDGAAFQPSLIASNAWIAIFGSNLTTQPMRMWESRDFTGNQLPRFLDDVTVRVNGRPAYISFMTPGQINALAPIDPLEGTTVTVEVINAQGRASVSVLKERFVPAFFRLNDAIHVAARLLDSTIVGPPGLLSPFAVTRPARPGEIVQLFLNGLGPTTPPIPDGSIPTSAASLSPASMSLTIGNTPVIPTFAGLTTTPGLYQINAVVPNVPDGEATVTFQIGGRTTQLPATLTVRR